MGVQANEAHHLATAGKLAHQWMLFVVMCLHHQLVRSGKGAVRVRTAVNTLLVKVGKVIRQISVIVK